MVSGELEMKEEEANSLSFLSVGAPPHPGPPKAHTLYLSLSLKMGCVVGGCCSCTSNKVVEVK